MKPIQKILVPVDYSPTAANAFSYALLLANKLNASIQLLNCVHPGMAAPEVPSLSVDLTNRLLEISQENMNEFINAGIRDVAKKIKQLPLLSEKIELGSAVPVAKAIAKTENADLIVMGTQGAHGFWEKLFGTVSSDILLNAPCPVLIVPENATFQEYKKFCYATDLKGFDVFYGKQLIKAFSPFKPDLHLLHINNSADQKHPFDFELVDLVYARQNIEVDVKIEEKVSKDIPNAIIESAHEQSAEMIVMSRPHYSIVDQLFHKSVTRNVAQSSDLPLLILPQEELEAELD